MSERLIDAKELKKRLHEYCIDNDTECQKIYDFLGIDECIDNAPTLNDQTYKIGYADGSRHGYEKGLNERPIAQWDYEQVFLHGVCTNCGAPVSSNLYDVFDYDEGMKNPYNTNYCPNCGARMVKGGDSDEPNNNSN